MNHRLESALEKIQQLPEVDQDFFATLFLDELTSMDEPEDGNDELDVLLARVRNRETFFDFVSGLITDRENAIAKERETPTEYLGACPDAGGWYNYEIESYLEAALAWSKSTGMKLPRDHSEEDLWRAFADFLYLGKLYE